MEEQGISSKSLRESYTLTIHLPSRYHLKNVHLAKHQHLLICFFYVSHFSEFQIQPSDTNDFSLQLFFIFFEFSCFSHNSYCPQNVYYASISRDRRSSSPQRHTCPLGKKQVIFYIATKQQNVPLQRQVVHV